MLGQGSQTPPIRRQATRPGLARPGPTGDHLVGQCHPGCNLATSMTHRRALSGQSVATNCGRAATTTDHELGHRPHVSCVAFEPGQQPLRAGRAPASCADAAQPPMSSTPSSWNPQPVEVMTSTPETPETWDTSLSTCPGRWPSCRSAADPSGGCPHSDPLPATCRPVGRMLLSVPPQVR